MKSILSMLMILASVSAHAGSSQPKTGTDDEIAYRIASATTMPRARVWRADRLWQTVDGQILVCEQQFRIGYEADKKCYAKGDADEQGRWSNLQTKQSDGFVLKGYEYRFVGMHGATVLIAYYGPPEPPKVGTVPVPAPQGPVTIDVSKVERLTISANRVIVQRKK